MEIKRWFEEPEEKHEGRVEGTPQRGFSEQVSQPPFQKYKQQLSDMNIKHTTESAATLCSHTSVPKQAGVSIQNQSST